MDEQTITDADVQEQALEQAQPEEQIAEAAQTTDSEPTTTEETTEEPASAENSEDDLADYWSKKGIDISTTEGQRKAAQSYREAEKRMHQSTQKASEIEKYLGAAPVEVDTDNPLVQQLAEEVVQMKRSTEVREFMQTNNITEEQNLAMGQWLQDNPAKTQLINAGYLTLQEAYELSGVGRADESALKSQGGREALEKLANKQRATSIPGNASSGAAPSALTKANADAWWDNLGAEGRRDPANQAKLDAVLGS